MGFPAGLMLCAWGRAIGCFPIEQSVPIVFIGSALGSALGFAVSVLPVSGAVLALQVLLIPSFLLMLRARGCGEDAIASRGGAPSSLDSGDEGLLERGVADMSAQASTLSMRILAGTCVYGLAAGLVEATLASSASSGASTDSFVLLLFALYCLAAIQLFGGSPLVSMRRILPTRETSSILRERSGKNLVECFRVAVIIYIHKDGGAVNRHYSVKLKPENQQITHNNSSSKVVFNDV